MRGQFFQSSMSNGRRTLQPSRGALAVTNVDVVMTTQGRTLKQEGVARDHVQVNCGGYEEGRDENKPR